MTPHRAPQSGVTLIEMLVALAVSSMIGLAGFIMLESISRTETGVSGRLALLQEQDRAFRLIALDAERALAGRLDDALVFEFRDHTVIWSAGGTGLIRKVEFRSRGELVQHVLHGPAEFTVSGTRLVTLTLTQDALWWVIKMPADQTG